jgi:hypothetical protein
MFSLKPGLSIDMLIIYAARSREEA